MTKHVTVVLLAPVVQHHDHYSTCDEQQAHHRHCNDQAEDATRQGTWVAVAGGAGSVGLSMLCLYSKHQVSGW